MSVRNTCVKERDDDAMVAKQLWLRDNIKTTLPGDGF